MRIKLLLKRMICSLLIVGLIASNISIEANAMQVAQLESIVKTESTEESMPEETAQPESTEESMPEETPQPESIEESMPEETPQPESIEESMPEETAQPESTEESIPEETTQPESTEESIPEETAQPESVTTTEDTEIPVIEEETLEAVEFEGEINEKEPEFIDVEADIDYGQTRYVTEQELTEIMLNAEGQDTVRKKIVNYAKSLKGTFPLFYYERNDDGEFTDDIICKQCCAYVNYVWYNVFRKDMWSDGVTSDMSRDGEKVYEFLQRTGAKSGDILFTRYYKSDDEKWSTHYMVILGYDDKGVWITDGYENKAGKAVLWRLDDKVTYKDKKGGWYRYLRPDGTHKDKKGSRYKKTNKYGQIYKLYKVDSKTWNKVADMPEVLPDTPTIDNVQVSADAVNGTYSVVADITAPGGLERVQFPTWTEANGQDDLVSKWRTNGAVSGAIKTLGNYKFKATFTVKISEHNGEQGDYITHIYAYDNYGQSVKAEAPVTSMIIPPDIRSASISSVNQNAGTYMIKMYVNKNVVLNRVQFPTWTEKDGQDDLNKGWKTDEACSGRIYEKADYYLIEYTVSTGDHNSERGKYITHAYAYGENGAYSKYELTPVNFETTLSGTVDDTSGKYSWALVGEPGNYELIISGEGGFYPNYSSYPWSPYVKEIVKVNIAEGITIIGYHAFKDCTALQEVILPSSLLAIERDAFRGCSQLPNTLYLPEALYKMGAGAFRNTPVQEVVFSGGKLAATSVSLGGVESETTTHSTNVTYENNTGDWIVSEKTWTSDNEYTYTKISTDGIKYTVSVILAGAFDEDTVFYYYPSVEGWETCPSSYLGYQAIPINTDIKSLKLDESYLSMVTGMTQKITCTTESKSAIEPDVIWSSENTEVATISNDGLITAVAEGCTVVTAKTRDGRCMVSCSVTIADCVTEVEFVEKDITLVVDDSDCLQVNVFPEIAPQSEFIWSSDDEGVATVDDNGTIIANHVGSTIIRARLKDNTELVAACAITVIPEIININLITDTMQLMPGEQQQLTYEINPFNRSDAPVKWSSSNPAVITVKDGLVKASESLAGGEAVVTVETVDGDFKDTCVIKVLSQIVDEVTYVESDADTVQVTGFCEEMVYTGKQIKQNVKVYCGRTLLSKDSDYTVTYENNIKAAKKTAKKAPLMKIELKGAYKGSYTRKFTILQADITTDEVVSITVAANNKIQKPIPSVVVNGKKLKNKADFIVSYPDGGGYKKPQDSPYTITVKGKGNYRGERTYHLYITNKKPMKDVKVTEISKLTYTGAEIKPDVTVKDFKVKYNGRVVDSSDYTISYDRNINVGKAKMIITAKDGSDYFGSKTVSFTISPIASLDKAKINENEWKSVISYNAECGEKVVQAEDASLLVVKVDGVSRLLNKDCYDVTYKNNHKAGTAIAIFKGKNGYSGTFEKKFTIKAYNIENSDGEVQITAPAVVYQKGGSKCIPVVTYKGTVLAAGKDYTLEYKNYTAVRKGTDRKPPTVIITGRGRFTGSIPVTYEIKKQDISSLRIEVKDVEYGKDYESIPVITDVNGKKLKAGVDYKAKPIYYIGEEIYDNYPDVGTVVYIEVEGIKNYEGSLSSSYCVIKKDIAKAKVSIKSQTYTGSAICPFKDQIVVKMNNKVVQPDNYEIIGYRNNVKAGKGQVILRGKNNYGGKITVEFKIIPKKMSKWL